MVLRVWQVVVTLIISLFAASCSTESKVARKRNIPVELHSGDIAFRRGTGAASRAVLFADFRGSYSHVGVVVRHENKWCVVHEVPYEGETTDDDKIYIEEIGEFYNTVKAASGAIYRHTDMNSTSLTGVRNYLMDKLKEEVPFDHDYDLSDESAQYCSELVWRSYLSVGVDITKGERTEVSLPGFAGLHILPADIEVNEDLECIYHF